MTIHHWEQGGQGGDPFSHCLATQAGAKEFPLVNKVEVWERPRGGTYPMGCLQAIQIHYSDGSSSPIFGKTGGAQHNSISFASGEFITIMYLGTSYNKTRIGWIYIETNKGQSWRSGTADADLAWGATVANGFLLGITGRHGDDIDRLGFYFMEELAAITVEMEYLTMPDPSSITMISYDVLQGDNRHGITDLHISINKGVDETNSATSEEGWIESFGVNTSVSGGFFGIGEASAGTEWSMTKTRSNSTSYSESSNISWSGSVAVPPGQYIQIDLLYYKGWFDISYEATVVMIGKSGAKYPLKRSGGMTGMASGVAVIKQTVLDRNMPNSGLEDTKPIDEDIPFDKLPPNTEIRGLDRK